MYSFYINKNIKIVIIDGDYNVYTYNEKNETSPFIEIKIDKNDLGELVNFFSRALVKTTPNCIELTDREIQVLKNMSKGLNNQEISNVMHVSVHTVKAHIHNIFEKLSAQDRTEAVVKALKDNLITL